MEVEVVEVNPYTIANVSARSAFSKNEFERRERISGGEFVLEVVPVRSKTAVSRIDPSDPLTDRGGVDDPAQLVGTDGSTRELFERRCRRQ